MRSVLEHRRIVLDLARPAELVQCPVQDSAGLVLGADVVARVDHPRFDTSAMDGYAVRVADVASATSQQPTSLRVAGDIAAGDTRQQVLEPGSALRIMTGAPMPERAEAVVAVELTDGGTTTVQVQAAVLADQHVRFRGGDFVSGAVLLSAGTMVTAGRLALIAAANVAEVMVYPRPRVAVFSTGDELAPPGSELAHGQIVDSNGPMLAALTRATGAEVVQCSQVPDDAAAVSSALRAADGVDLILTTGGVSMGAYDTVKEVLSRSGEVDFVKVAMKPGMPQGAGHIGERRTPIVTLPGNPVSALVSFHVFVAPLLTRLSGAQLDLTALDTIDAKAAQGWSASSGRVDFTRVSLAADGCRPCGGQQSHMLGALAQADALAVIPEEVDRVEPGDQVKVIPLVGQGIGRPR